MPVARMMPRAPSGPREVVGVAVHGDARLTAARLIAVGDGLEMRVEIEDRATCPLSAPLSADIQHANRDELTPRRLAQVGSALAQAVASLVEDLVPAAALGEALALGLSEPGLWCLDNHQPSAWLPVADSTTLAVATGLNVVDGFPVRDLAMGGRGGPVDALSRWVLLRDAKKPRVLLDAGPRRSLTYLPSGCDASGAARVMQWSLRSEPESVDATEALAERVVSAIDERIPNVPPIQQIVLAGSGDQEELLRTCISQGQPKLNLVSLEELRLDTDLLDAACAGVLALLHIDHVPAMNTLLTDAPPRVLGRLTPGSPQSWQRLLHQMTANRPATMPLRSAI